VAEEVWAVRTKRFAIIALLSSIERVLAKQRGR
jgi:hypothetical protein